MVLGIFFHLMIGGRTGMKLLFYIGFILLALFISICLPRVLFRMISKTQTVFIVILLVNIMILGFGSLWWFHTETDGISQGIGLIVYGLAFVVMDIIALLLVTTQKGKTP